MDHSQWRQLVIVVLAATAGCGGGGPVAGDMQAPADGATFCRKLAALMNSKGGCYPSSPTAIARELDVDGSCARIAAALAAGRISYDQGQATMCLNAVDAMSCGTGFTYEQVHLACAAALPGVAQTGQSCNRLWRAARLSDCAEGNFCNTVGVCPGVCQRFAQANESCDNLHPCRLELMCGTADGLCHARPAAGGRCVILDSQLAVLPELTVVPPCPGDQYCSRATLTCAPYVPDGQTCMPAEGGCRGHCVTESLNTPGKCVPVGGPGASCSGSRTSATRAYNGDLFLAQAPPCGFGLGCSAGSCRDQPNVGEPCETSLNACAPGGICDEDLVCQAAPPRANADCFPGTVCGHSGEACCGSVVVSLEPPYVSGGCASGAACGASGLCP